MYTESDAKQKWCPFARVSYQSPAVEGICGREEGYIGNREHSDGPISSSMCIGSACMAWRWGNPQRKLRRIYRDDPLWGEITKSRHEPIAMDDGYWSYQYTDCDAKGEFELLRQAFPEDTPLVGHCGLAGRPE